eukprot:10281682-Alexandrium_andersonii.AAC.1
MSASLVGSEMCIRDRQNPGVAVSRCPLFKEGASLMRATKCRPLGPGLKPVSYTHLTLPTICSV